jgi:glycosyltransferase involved in cell wall biosynthesis
LERALTAPAAAAPGSADPLISVITVVYNGERFLGDTLASVQAQDYPKLEHWLIDGGSTDGTLQIVRGHAEHLAGWISEPDRGIADAFNKGIDRASGDYLMFLNSDDALAHPRALADMVAFAREHAWPDVVYGDCDLYDPDSGAFQYRFVINYDRERFLRCETLPHPGMLMSRRYFNTYGRFDISFKVGMDYELFLRGVPQVGAMRVPALVTNVRTGGISARSRALVVEETIRALKNNGYLTNLGEQRLRAAYAARGAARRALEAVGLYRVFDAMRRGEKQGAGR